MAENAWAVKCREFLRREAWRTDGERLVVEQQLAYCERGIEPYFAVKGLIERRLGEVSNADA